MFSGPRNSLDNYCTTTVLETPLDPLKLSYFLNQLFCLDQRRKYLDYGDNPQLVIHDTSFLYLEILLPIVYPNETHASQEVEYEVEVCK